MPYDVAVVGSGIAGMSAAVALAKEGRRVIVIEANDEPGGLMRTYRRDGLIVRTGVNIVGGLGEGEILWRYFKYLGVLDRLKPERMEGDDSLEVRFPEMRFRFRGGPEQFLEDLIEAFGGEGRVAERFVRDMHNLVSEFPLYMFERREKKLGAWTVRKSLAQYFDDLGAREDERALLSGLNPFHGVPPSECPLPVHFLVMDSFINSRWRLDESEKPLVQAFVEALEANGGEVVCGAAVTAIETDHRTVPGVRLETDDVIEAATVIYTGHPRQLLHLLPEGTMSPAFRERVAGLDDTTSVFAVNALSDDPEARPNVGCTIAYADWDTERHYRQKLFAESADPSMLFMHFGDGLNGAWGVKIVAVDHEQQWAKWKSTRTGRRDEDYRQAKARLAEHVLKVACERMGIDNAALRVVDVFTPLTIRDYTNSPTCGVYGVKKSLAVSSAATFSTRTRVAGLYLAGQSILLPGVVGTVISAMDACGSILGHDNFMDSIERAAM